MLFSLPRAPPQPYPLPDPSVLLNPKLKPALPTLSVPHHLELALSYQAGKLLGRDLIFFYLNQDTFPYLATTGSHGQRALGRGQGPSYVKSKFGPSQEPDRQIDKSLKEYQMALK